MTGRRGGAKKLELFAVSPPGLEQLLLAEVLELGIVGAAAEAGGVAFHGDMRALYRANLYLRIASRILVRIARFHATAFHEVERHAGRIQWQQHCNAATRVNLRVTCRKSKLYHSDAVAERIARVIQQKAGAVVHAGADDDETAAASESSSQLFVVRFFHDECQISADSSGAHLHMRGYREALAKAPMRETLAAALVRASGWQGTTPLIDPMCGAGTIAIEAALIARRVAPALSRADRTPRPFSFERWPSHNASVWDAEVQAARALVLPEAPAAILASDRDDGALAATRQNAERAGVADSLSLSRRAISAVEPPDSAGSIICNPPYGKRVGEEKALRALYAGLGNLLRTRFPGWGFTMLSGNAVLDRHIGLSFQTVARTTNGGIPVRIVRATVDGA